MATLPAISALPNFFALLIRESPDEIGLHSDPGTASEAAYGDEISAVAATGIGAALSSAKGLPFCRDQKAA